MKQFLSFVSIRFLSGSLILFTSCASSTLSPGIDPLKKAIIVGDGNSLMYGLGVNGTGDILTQLSQREPLASDSIRYYNFGVSGQTTLQMLADIDTQVLPVYDPHQTNFLIFLEGGNDIFFNGNVDSAYQNILTYVRKAKAKGFKVIIITCFARDQTPQYGGTAEEYDQKLVALNALIQKNPNEFDSIVDSRSITVLATRQAITTTYYLDRIHLTKAGYALLVDKLVPILTSWTASQ